VRDGRPVAFVSLARQPDAAPIVAWVRAQLTELTEPWADVAP
jgi:hypothetical protein